jgi:hypothetical protein
LLIDWFDVQFDMIIELHTLDDPTKELVERYNVKIRNCFIDRYKTLTAVCENFNKIIDDFIKLFVIDVDYDPQEISKYHTEQNFCREKICNSKESS